MFMAIASRAGESFFRPLKISLSRGLRSLASFLVRPEASASFIIPPQVAIAPPIVRMRLTAC